MSDSRSSTDALHGYPRPQLRRDSWRSLDGPWEFVADPQARWRTPPDVTWAGRTIVVPFAPETRASGIHETGFLARCWYRRTLEPWDPGDGRVFLHFGAVDYRATVWVDDRPVARHEGGYTPFECDITEAMRAGRPVTVVVRADDDPLDLAKPRGKQDWLLEPHSIWYPRTTGIWQSVWLERVPRAWVQRLRWTPSLVAWDLHLECWFGGDLSEPLQLEVTIMSGERLLARDCYEVTGDELSRRIAFSDPGIDDSRNALLWSPESPHLLDVTLELRTVAGERVDVVESYTALREVAVSADRFVLNGRPYYLRLVLDQGYWPDSGSTAPDDAALQRDVELARAMGFNGVRKHQKIEAPRYLYWADRLGLLVWEEMPSAYRFTSVSVERLTREWLDVLARDRSHPCIVAWVPFNESWGVPNLPDNPSHRHYVQALYHLTRTIDPHRPVIGNDGWESSATDLVGIHDYDADPQRLRARYHSDDIVPRLFRKERPGGRVLVLEGHANLDHPIVLSEFGGIACSAEQRTWGYSRCDTGEALQARYAELVQAVHDSRIFAGFCYTQFADTYQEANGLLSADRTPKFPLDDIQRATRGVSRR
ncbi:beta-galactosidase [Luteitalea sp. TBR-22]|uniref:glycoside hydrolase family 2 protein n=1 Tax=Luteitalea sp. TBR-22 TaxID=2802971 RepID=UPI001AF40893|nr:glycoside hydrolase family 2 TIM barrel-domain containing protein [Luteitalea sp. TBR-22]BCS34438.1 beta-galactosidase [Luteitalea sp. TBR-22]